LFGLGHSDFRCLDAWTLYGVLKLRAALTLATVLSNGQVKKALFRQDWLYLQLSVLTKTAREFNDETKANDQRCVRRNRRHERLRQ
jgi:hypothetical protein